MLKATNPVLSFYAASTGGSALTSIAVPCTTNNAAATTTIYVGASLATSTTFAMTSSSPGLLAVSPSGNQVIASATARTAFTLTPIAGCNGYAAASNLTLTLTGSGFTTSPSSPLPVTNTASGPVLSFYAASSGGSALSSALAVPCVTNTGAPTTVYVGSSSATAASFTVVSSGTVTVAPATTQTVSSASRIAFTISPPAGCNAYSSASSITLTITPANATTFGTTGSPMAVTNTTAGTTGLSPSSATFNFTCILSNGSYYPSPAQTLYVGSTFASGGTPFTVGGTPANWVTVGNPSLGTAPYNTTPPGGSAIVLTPASSGNVCDGLSGSATTATTFTLASTGATLTAGGSVAAVTITVNITMVPASASPLTLFPASLTVYCSKVGAVYTPSYPQTITVTSASALSFSVDTVTNPPAAWLSVSPTSAQIANSTGVQVAVGGKGTCDSIVGAGTGSSTVHLLDPPYADKTFNVTIALIQASPITATPAAPSLTYVKGSGITGFVDVNIASSLPLTLPNPFFSVQTGSLPSWLRLDSVSGNAPLSLRFSSTGVADSLAPGTYTATVAISVAGYGDLDVTVSMLLTNKAPQLAVQAPSAAYTCTPASATTFCIPWTIGQPFPTPTITAISSDSPIAYSATTGGLLAPVVPVAEQNGLAYSFGTPINLTFSPQAFASAQPGNILTGTLTLTWGSPVSTTVITFDVNVLSPGATITSITPSSLPVGSASYTVQVTGTGFTPSTRFGVVPVNGGAMNFDTNIQYSSGYINQSNYQLTIVNQASDQYIPFNGTNPFGGAVDGGTFTIGACNPIGGAACTNASGSFAITVGTNPIINAVTTSSALLEGGAVTVAPYDMVTIFGTNFCPGCVGNQILTNSPDPVTLTYPASLLATGGNSLTVTFSPASGSSFTATNAPLLFATNSQINLLVPSVIAAAIGSVNVDIVVNYGGVSPASSAAFVVTPVAQNPGIFTVGADGQGSGAALDLNYNLISAGNPAGLRTGVTKSDIISLYMTGMGAPDSLASNASATGDAGLVYPTDCVTTASYLGSNILNPSFDYSDTGTQLTTLDGTVIIPTVLNTGRLQPCIVPADITHIYIGGVDAVAGLKYAGWVADTVAGLYQLNVQLPALAANAFTTEAGATSQSVVAPVQVPVQVVMSGGKTTQTGVSLWVAPRLLVTGPSTGTINNVSNAPNSLAATVGVALPSTNNAVLATGGFNDNLITYAVTSGFLPQGLSLDPGPLSTDGNAGLISGTPAAGTEGTYSVTVTASDTSPIPITGTVTFVIQVGNGLFTSNTVPTASTFGTANGSVTTVSASGGVSPYSYSIANTILTHALPNTLTINGGVVSTTAATPAGTYTVKVTATDSTSGTPLTGSDTFPITVGLKVGPAVVTPATNSGWTTSVAYNTMPTTGGSGTYSYALDVASQLFVTQNSSWLTFSTSTGILTITAAPTVTGSFNMTVTATDTSPANNTTAAGTGTTTFAFAIGS